MTQAIQSACFLKPVTLWATPNAVIVSQAGHTAEA
jgi:hypothetical protein